MSIKNKSEETHLMMNCPRCNTGCEWNENAFHCNNCKMVFFCEGVDWDEQYGRFISDIFLEVGKVCDTHRQFLYDLHFEHINNKPNMSTERAEIFNLFCQYRKLESEIIGMSSYRDSDEPFPKDFFFPRCDINEYQFRVKLYQIESIKKDILRVLT